MDDHVHQEIEIPHYFICPISLQIMKDPVTAITGITYDRESIEQWLFSNNNTTCPVTKMPLPRDSDLTPNHTLRRLTQSWCTQNSCYGIDRIPTPKPPLNKGHVLKLLKGLKDKDPNLKIKSLRQLELLATENQRNKKCLLEAGVPKVMIFFILSCYKKRVIEKGIEEALSLLQFVKIPSEEVKVILSESGDQEVLDSLTWVLGCEDLENSVAVKSHVVMVIKTLIQKDDPSILERLKPEFFEKIVKVLRNGVLTQQGVGAALKVLLNACSVGRNRVMMVESNAVFELIEIEMMFPEKRITELNVGILLHLCSCASGRAQFLCHKGAIGVLTERLLKASVVVDDRVMFIFSLICKFSATQVVLQEMLGVGTVAKLCVLLQTDRDKYLKDRALEILRTHSEVWRNSPCFHDKSSFYASLH